MCFDTGLFFIVYMLKNTLCETFWYLCMFTFLGDVEMRIPWTARSSNQSIFKEINPEYSLEGLMLKEKLQYFGHPMRTADWLEKSLMLGKVEGRRRRGHQRVRRLDGTTAAVDVNLGKLQEMARGSEAAQPAVHGGHKELDMTERLENNNHISQ